MHKFNSSGALAINPANLDCQRHVLNISWIDIFLVKVSVQMPDSDVSKGFWTKVRPPRVVVAQKQTKP